MQIGEDQRLVKGNFTEQLQQILHFFLKDLMRQSMSVHQFIELLETCMGRHG